MKNTLYEIDYFPVLNDSFPHVLSFGEGYDINSPNSYTKLTENKSLNITPDFNNIIINDKCILSDNLSQFYVSSMGLLISERLKNLLSGLSVQPCDFYPARVKYKKKYYDYFWLHFIEKIEKELDFTKSLFYIKRKSNSKKEELVFSSYEDYENQISAFSPKVEVWAKELFFHKEEQKKDLFFILLTGYKLYGTQALYDAVIKNNISGFKFKKI